MKIDIFAHILPPRYKARLDRDGSPLAAKIYTTQRVLPTLFDLDRRFRIMDKFPGYTQVLSLSMPPVENFRDPKKAVEMSRLANDEMAELVARYPDRFDTAVACLPMNDMDAALREADRAIKDLGFRGVQIFTPTSGKPLDAPEFLPLYEKMCRHDLPILLHPQRFESYAEYPGEEVSRYNIYGMLGWPYETSVAMVRLVFSGIFERYPQLKIVTHHAGGMIPFFENRIVGWIESHDKLLGRKDGDILTKPISDCFKMFYADTAIYGHTPGLMCAYEFFGPDKLVFGTDMPWDKDLGLLYTGATITSVERMAIGEAERKKIFEDNTRKLLRLPER